MEIGGVILLSLLLFVIVYVAVRLAISPLIPGEEISEDTSEGMNLIKLRDIGVFNNDELEKVIRFYEQKGIKKYAEFDRYCKILSELKDAGYINDQEFETKIAHLKEFYHK